MGEVVDIKQAAINEILQDIYNTFTKEWIEENLIETD